MLCSKLHAVSFWCATFRRLGNNFVVWAKTAESRYTHCAGKLPQAGSKMNVNRLALIAYILSVVLALAALFLSEIQGGIIVRGWGGAGP
jgi:hypothetical protein